MDKSIRLLLSRLGITANYRGYHQVSYAVLLAAREQEQLLFVTKSLYPAVAAHYGTSWTCVERNIRTVIALVWEQRRETLEEIAQRPLPRKPSVSQFLAILAAWVAEE